MAQRVDVDRVRLPAFGLASDLSKGVTGWHAHAKHQLLFAAEGVLHLEVPDAQWLLPPQRGAWINARQRHRVRVNRSAKLRTVYLSSRLAAGVEGTCRVFAVTPLAREMILHAMRWGPERQRPDPTSGLFFRTLARLCAEWINDSQPLRLPTASTPELERAMAHVMARLSRSVSLESAASAAGVSPRTLARRFAEETQMTFSRFSQTARMMRAMELLAQPGNNVTETAYAVGFESLGAFTRAFTSVAGEGPRTFRKRVRGGGAGHS